MVLYKIFVGMLAFAAGLALLALVAGQMGWLTGQPPSDLGVHEGKLKRPSRTPNSVSSQAALWPGPMAREAMIDPINIPASSDPDRGAKTLHAIDRIVSALPGVVVVKREPDYLYAQCTTRWMKYVDDIEFWHDAKADAIQVRSASRVGRKDFGVNRARVEHVRAALLRPAP